MNKLTLNIDSTSLSTSGCMLRFIRTVVGDPSQPEVGAYRNHVNNVNLNYGIAIHKFLDVMYKTKGHYPTAKKEAIDWFVNTPHIPDSKKGWMSDPKHIMTTAYMVWTEFVEKDGSFELLQLPGKCFWCRGDGEIDHCTKQNSTEERPVPVMVDCVHCNGTGTDPHQSATEVTFSIPYYEDEFLSVNLCGTIDKVGKFVGGVYDIDDWKTTGHRSDKPQERKQYFGQYELSRQLRLYTLACKIMAKRHPESIMGQVGATRMGASITAIFLKPNANETVTERSDVMSYGDEELDAFEWTLMEFIRKISFSVKQNLYPKEGILNGSCEGRWGHCSFWNACKNRDNIAQVYLNQNFKRTPFNPLAYND